MLRSAKLLLAICPLVPAFCQAPAGAPAFDVAELKLNKSGDMNMSGDFGKGGQLTARNVPLKYLIAEGYHVRMDQLEAPGWTGSERYDIVAKAAPTTSTDELRRMVIRLLQDRLKLATHTEQKPMQVFVLVVGKGGPKLTKSTGEPPEVRPGYNHCRASVTPAGDRSMECSYMSMAQLAQSLPLMVPGYVQMPVVDQTAIEGLYDFKLNFTPAGRMERSETGAADSAAPVGMGLSFFDALQSQVGLKLEGKKVPMPVIVVDHIERTPPEN